MTIAAGFVCQDGLLFASDTLYSGAQQNRYGRKFWQSQWGDTLAIFGGSGTEAGLLRARDEIERRSRGTEDRYVVINAIEEALAVVEEKLKPADYERTSALIGIRVRDHCWLYENQAGRSMLSVIDHNSQCVGAASSLGLYFARSLFTEDMPIAWAKVVAVHLVKQVKTYASGWCGGDTHLFTLPMYGDTVLETDQEDVRKLEAHLTEVDEAVRLVLPSHNTPDETLRFRLRLLNRVVKKLRQNVVVDLPGSPDAMTLGDWLSSS